MRTARRPERAFTLIELMVVIVILGGLIAIVAPNIWQSMRRAELNEARTQMSAYANAVDLYRMDYRGRLPEDLETLMLENPETGESYMRTIREDPWGTPYEFRVVGPKKFLIVSAGPDRVFDTDDDLSWPWSDDK